MILILSLSATYKNLLELSLITKKKLRSTKTSVVAAVIEELGTNTTRRVFEELTVQIVC